MKHFFVLILLLIAVNTATAQIPNQISWQGVLQDSQGELLNGNYDLTVKIYDVATGGTALWSETHNGLAITDGLVNLMLGSINDLNVSFDSQYWLEITIGEGTPLSRIMLTSVPYSMYAKTAPNEIQGEPLILRDSDGNMRMRLNPDEGIFEMFDDEEELWYSMQVNSPPIITSNMGEVTVIGNYSEFIMANSETGNMVSHYKSEKTDKIFGEKVTEKHFCGTSENKVVEEKVREIWRDPFELDNYGITSSNIVRKFDEDGEIEEEVEVVNVGEKIIKRVRKTRIGSQLVIVEEYKKEGIKETSTRYQHDAEGNVTNTVYRENFDNLNTEDNYGYKSSRTIKETPDGHKSEYYDTERIDFLMEGLIRKYHWNTYRPAGDVNSFTRTETIGTKTITTISQTQEGYSDVVYFRQQETVSDLNGSSTEYFGPTGVAFFQTQTDINRAEQSITTTVATPVGTKSTSITQGTSSVDIQGNTTIQGNLGITNENGDRILLQQPNGFMGAISIQSAGSENPIVAIDFAQDGKTQIHNGVNINGNSEITGDVGVSGYLHTSGNSTTEGNSYTYGNSYVDGNQDIWGDLNVEGTKNFRIDHPLDPQNKYLLHASMESNEVLNTYSGNVITNSQGNAIVYLPEYFEAINTDFRYQLTVIGEFAQAIIYKKIENNQFEIKTDKPNIEVSWQVIARRNDERLRNNPFNDVIDK